MKHTTLFGLLFLSASSAFAAGTVEYAIQKLPRRTPSKTRRRDVISPALLTNFDNNDGLAYYLNLTVGTPGQLQTVQLDTGSSDLYFSASNASFCSSEPGCTGGTFDSSKSSTFNLVSTNTFNATFADGSLEIGDYFTDVVQIGDLAVSGVQMGLAYDINSTVGANTALMGVGYSINEAVNSADDFYPNFLEALVGSEAIASRLYSLYLNKLEDYGSIVFGGVDTEKFDSDELTTLNCMASAYGEVDNFYLLLDNVTATSNGGGTQTVIRSTRSYPIAILPDSGSTAWELPTENYDLMVELLDVDHDYLTKPCSEVRRGVSNTTHFEFVFSGNGTNTATLRLEAADLFTPLTNDDGSAATDDAGAALCVLRIQDAGEGAELFTVGDAVMRAGYWVFDLDNGQVSLAQASLGANASNIVAVEAGPDGLKDVAKVKTAAQQDIVAETMTASGTYGLSTAASTIGYTTGAEAYPSVTPAESTTKGGTGHSGLSTSSGGSSGASASPSEGAADATAPSFGVGAYSIIAASTALWMIVGALLL